MVAMRRWVGQMTEKIIKSDGMDGRLHRGGEGRGDGGLVRGRGTKRSTTCGWVLTSFPGFIVLGVFVSPGGHPRQASPFAASGHHKVRHGMGGGE